MLSEVIKETEKGQPVVQMGNPGALQGIQRMAATYQVKYKGVGSLEENLVLVNDPGKEAAPLSKVLAVLEADLRRVHKSGVIILEVSLVDVRSIVLPLAL
jgi:hypothetical protein